MLTRILATDAPPAVFLIRLMVGGVFVSEGIQKFLFSDQLGVGRFVKIGIPFPELMAPFVGIVEVVCGGLMLLGLGTRLAAVPLLVNIFVALLSTKVPILLWSRFLGLSAPEAGILRRVEHAPRSSDRPIHVARPGLPPDRWGRGVVDRRQTDGSLNAGQRSNRHHIERSGSYPCDPSRMDADCSSDGESVRAIGAGVRPRAPIVRVERTTRTFNLEVEEHASFFVAASPSTPAVWVHNVRMNRGHTAMGGASGIVQI